MKKQVKILSIILVIMMVMTSISSVVLAVKGDEVIKDINNSASNIQADTETNKITEMGGRIVVIMQTVGIVVAVVILLVLGIKYMIGSAEEKAEYKKTMIPYVVGAILIFAATTIVNVVYQIANGLSATGK